MSGQVLHFLELQQKRVQADFYGWESVKSPTESECSKKLFVERNCSPRKRERDWKQSRDELGSSGWGGEDEQLEVQQNRTVEPGNGVESELTICRQKQLERIRGEQEARREEGAVMAGGGTSIVAGLVTMLSRSWTVVPVALVVALVTWMWWNRGRSREESETRRAGRDRARGAESGAEPGVDTAVGADTENVDILKSKETAELSIDVHLSTVTEEDVASEPKVISDTMVSDQREMDLAPALSKKQDLFPVDLTSDKMQNELRIQPSSGENSPLHNACAAEHNLEKETRHGCEKITPSQSAGEVFHRSDKDKALDRVSADDQKFGGTDCQPLTWTNQDVGDSNGDMPANFNAIELEMEKLKRKNIKLVFRDESEKTATSPELENMAKKVAAVSPLPVNNVSVTFNVHYITCSNSQFLAVIGNHECLGQWDTCVPLKPNKDGFWSNSILLPVHSKFEWKYVVVEHGKICRWEECLNRCLETSHEDMEIYQCWGYH
ncbi:uncharacterized protein stbd1 [Narcine bancroftii]|uniref:uncharacterized protein stbd1 n=1 Tax=Narcine bancroftii TaxID=1343680 RepID=UPI0038322A8B